MKTLLAVPWEELGGVTTVVQNLARYLQVRGHQVLFFIPGHEIVLRTRTTTSGFPGAQLRLCFPFALPRRIISAVAFPFLFPVILLQLLWFLRRQGIQVINLHYPVENFFYFAICKRLLSIRLVTSVHGGDAFLNAKPRDRYSRAFRFLIRSSDLIILPSDAYRKKLLEAFPAAADRTVFIHNGIDPGQFIAEETSSRRPQTPGRSGTDRYILCVAHLRDYKGIDVLLRASAPLLVSDPSLRLVLAGDGLLRDQLEKLAASLGIHRQTYFLGMKEPAEIAKLLHGCEVFVLPSREESFGLAVVEAMACRKPVVATAVGGITEIIEDEKSGLLVEPENPVALTEALRRVLSDTGLKRKLAEEGYVRVMERFCFARTGTAYESAFASLLESSTASLHSSSRTTGRDG